MRLDPTHRDARPADGFAVLVTRLAPPLALVIAIAIAIGVFAPRPLAQGPASDVALTIDGTAIPVADYARWLVRLRGEAKAIDYVESHLLEREAVRLGVDVSPDAVLDEVHARLQRRIDASCSGDRSLWVAELDREHRTPRGVERELFLSVRDELRAQALLRRRGLADDVAQSGPAMSPERTGLSESLLSGVAWEALPSLWAGPDPEDPGDPSALGRPDVPTIGSHLEPRPADEAVLVIDGAPVRRDVYTRWLMHFNGELLAPMFVESFVLARAAEERGLSISRDDLERRIDEEIERRFDMSGLETRAQWTASLAQRRRSEESMMRDMLVTHGPIFLAEDMLRADRVITDADVVRAWEETYGEGGRRLDARLIRLQVPATLPRAGERTDAELAKVRAAYEKTRARAVELLERLDAGEDFGALARQHSDDASAANGGELEGGLVLADWPEATLEALSKLEVGEHSGLLEVGTSICIFEVLEHRVTPLAAVQGELRRRLSAARPTIPELAIYRNVLVRDVPWTVEPGMSE
jgi:hypothetical protein